MKCVKRIQTKFEDFVHRLCLHLQSFWAPWLIIGCMLFAVLVLGSPLKLYVLLGLIALFVIMVLIKPMNIIHGLIGTRGDIRLFFLMFFLINVLFAGIYYYGFFCNAGITYDCNQPHIEFELFKTTNDKGKLVISSRDEESLPSTCSNQDHYYYRTTCQWVLQNTILTSLMQEPTDFFSASGTYTGSFQNNVDRNLITASIFHVFLIFHILVSWILLGVFISLIYQKFRNN